MRCATSLLRVLHTTLTAILLSCLVPTSTSRAQETAGQEPAIQESEPSLDIKSRPQTSGDLSPIQRERGSDDVPIFEDTIDVGLRTYRVQAVDRRGVPIEGLGKRDFDVKLGDEFVNVESVRWIKVPTPASEPVIDAGQSASQITPGRFLLFVQAGREPFFGRSHMRLQRQIREFLGGLEPGAAVAVVSYDSRLKLWLDFTRDRDLVERVAAVAGRFTAEPGEQPATASDLPSLRRIWNPQLARDINTAEQGLEVLAQYMDELPGTETMIYVGWGLSHFNRRSAQRSRQFNRATESLADAGVQVFVLGVIETDLQTLGNGLLELADATGGVYFHSRDIPASRMRELASSLSAHYLLTLDEADLADAMRREPKRDPHRDLKISLRFEDGRVYGPPRPVAD